MYICGMNGIPKLFCKFLFLLAVTLATGCMQKQQNAAHTSALLMNKTYTTTFKLKPCSEVVLTYYDKMSDQRDSIPPQKTKTITDRAAINRITSIVGHLPDKGDIMIKLGDASILETTFVYPDSAVYFTFYESKLKTPATSFYAPKHKEEQVLYEYLISLLNQ